MARSLAVFVCVASALAPMTLHAGPLSPPAGPVTSSGRTLGEIEPRVAISALTTPGDNDATPSQFKITAPGSYFLTGNITGAANRICIEIAAGCVTLDLGGFELVGVANSRDGISITAAGISSVRVFNGCVRSFAQDGIDLGSISTTGCSVTDVRTSGNGAWGIWVGGSGFVQRCVSVQNAVGIFSGPNSIIRDCSAASNTGQGIACQTGCTVTDCTSTGNTFDGFSVQIGCTVVGCTASANQGNGIGADDRCVISNCTASGNAGTGILVDTGSNASDCVASGNGAGFTLGDRASIRGCTAINNAGDGINATSYCLIRDNSCSSNAIGIHLLSPGNRVEGNNCTGAAGNRGIKVDAANNVIVRNTCTAYTNAWEIVAGNVVAPIIDRRAPGGPAILGNSTAGTLGSTDPLANYTY